MAPILTEAVAMTETLAVVGKGGTGKTTFAALTVKYLREVGLTPILAIDADPSSNLNMALGMDLGETVGQIREDTREQVSGGTFEAGISKPDWFQYQVEQCVVEGDDVDLLAMGRPEGPGCYCAANHMLRAAIDRIGNSYRAVVIDNEAGMEHISRQTTRDVDWLFIMSDPSQRGLAAAEQIVRLVASLGARIGRAGLVINRVAGELPEDFRNRAEALGIPLLGLLPQDPEIGRYDAEGRPLVELDESSAIYPAVKAVLQKCLQVPDRV
jgi:CO dehydrogenase maturation factor